MTEVMCFAVFVLWAGSVVINPIIGRGVDEISAFEDALESAKADVAVKAGSARLRMVVRQDALRAPDRTYECLRKLSLDPEWVNQE